MSGVTGAVVAGAVIAGGATIAASNTAAGAARDAGNAQVNAANYAASAQLKGTEESIAAQQAMADKAAAVFQQQAAQARADLAPFRQAQLSALQQAQALTDPNNPYYQAQEKYNTTAIQRRLAAQGLLRSKSQVNLLSNLQLWLNQQRANQVNSLANLGAVQQSAQISQGLGAQLGGLYGNLGGSMGNTYANSGNVLAGIYQGAGQAQANAAIGIGQANAGMIAGLGNTIQGGIQSYIGIQQQDALMKSIYGGGAPTGSLVPLSQQIANYRIPSF